MSWITDMSADSDLSLIPTLDLIAELKRRCDAVVVCMETDFPNGDKHDSCFEWNGGLSRCMGLVERARLDMADAARDSRTDKP